MKTWYNSVAELLLIRWLDRVTIRKKDFLGDAFSFFLEIVLATSLSSLFPFGSAKHYKEEEAKKRFK